MRCPNEGCVYGEQRVAQHLQEAHRHLGPREKRRLLAGLQWRRMLEQVRELRVSRPHPPLATQLDLEEGRSPPGRNHRGRRRRQQEEAAAEAAEESKMGRVMAEGKTGLRSWRFLDDADRVLGWPCELSKQGKRITTFKVPCPLSDLDPDALGPAVAEEARRHPGAPALRLHGALSHFALRPSIRRETPQNSQGIW